MEEKVTLSLEVLYNLLEEAYNNGFDQKELYKKLKLDNEQSAVVKCNTCIYRTNTGCSKSSNCELALKFMQKE